MLAYIARRLLLMIPTVFGIMLVSFIIVQFAPGGPVERIVAQLQGLDAGATSRFGGGGSDIGATGGGQVGGAGADMSGKYRGAQGLDPKFIAELEKQFGFDKPAPERFLIMLKNYSLFNFGRSYFRDVPVLQLIREKLPVSISLGLWMTLLSYAISVPLGISKAVNDGSRFDVWSSAVVIVGYAIPSFLFAILLIVLFAGRIVLADISAARPDIGIFRSALGLRQGDGLFLAHHAAGDLDGARRIRHRDLSDQEFLPGRNQETVRSDRANERLE